VVTKKISNFPSLDIKENDYFEIKKEYFEGSGLSEKDIIIYPRNDFKKQWKFLKDEVIEKSTFGWILGPPGTGKSVCAFSFLLNLNFNEWKITWFHLPRSLSPLWLQIHENLILKGDVSLNNDIEEILHTEKEKKHIVFIDGYKSLDSHSNFLRSCHDWFKQNKEMNRLVIICSMTSRGKTNNEDDKYFGVKEFFVNSWKIDEYYKQFKMKNFLIRLNNI
jgi:hypothetical protein